METLGGATIERDGPTTLHDAVHQLLPDVGSVKVRRDPPGFEHPTHTHDVDEILLIISGAITFSVGPDSTTCGSGDRLLLPKGTHHSSAAGRDGCVYVIATR